MKKSRIRIALSLTLLLLVAISIQAFAVAGADGSHTHTWATTTRVRFEPAGSAKHIKVLITYHTCTGCGMQYEERVEAGSADHTFGSSTYTGENYHLGDLHYARFRSTCTICSYVRLEWVHYRCLGNGGHIVPNAFNPIPTSR